MEGGGDWVGGEDVGGGGRFGGGKEVGSGRCCFPGRLGEPSQGGWESGGGWECGMGLGWVLDDQRIVRKFPAVIRKEAALIHQSLDFVACKADRSTAQLSALRRLGMKDALLAETQQGALQVAGGAQHLERAMVTNLSVDTWNELRALHEHQKGGLESPGSMLPKESVLQVTNQSIGIAHFSITERVLLCTHEENPYVAEMPSMKSPFTRMCGLVSLLVSLFILFLRFFISLCCSIA